MLVASLFENHRNVPVTHMCMCFLSDDPITYVKAVVDTADALGWTEPFTVCGHSMGAGVGALVTAAFGAKVNALVMIEQLGHVSRPEEDTAGQACMCAPAVN